MLGVSSPATLRQCLGADCSLRSVTWEHHENFFASGMSPKDGPGRSYATVSYGPAAIRSPCRGRTTRSSSALLQAEGLSEYISNYRRRMFSSAAAIFWMYNDSWPVTHGWTIVDYYRRKKLAYHPVRRAFAPITVVVAEEGDEIVVFGVNDTPEQWTGELRYGLFLLAGGRPGEATEAVTLPANASTPLAKLSRAEWEKLGFEKSGAFAQLVQDGQPTAQHRLLFARFKDLEFAAPEIGLRLADGVLTLTSDAFAWGLCLDVDGEAPLADNCFDLIPGLPHAMAWPADLGEPRVVALGNRDAVAPRS